MSTQTEWRKLTAVLHADVKDYGRLMGDDEAATVRTLATYREELVRLVELRGGRLVDTAGDGFLVEFPSAVESIACATEFQKVISERNAELPEDRRMYFRIGINIGDVIQRGSEIFGDGVNIAARLEGLADPGGICISGTAYDQVKTKLDLEYVYLGKQSVKNIEDPVRAYRVKLEDGKGDSISCKVDLRGSRKMRIAAISAAAGLTILVFAIGVWFFHLRFSAPLKRIKTAIASELKVPENPSVAVLPFTNMSGDSDQDYFGDGITEEIITGLAKVPRLTVIARNSSFAYKGKAVNVRDVGRELGVTYVLEGSVRKVGDRVRITAQLIDARNGHHLWAERYDRDFKDIFSLQDEITRKIVLALRVKLTDGEQIRLWKKMAGPTDPEAYDKALRAFEHLNKLSRHGNAGARKLFEEAMNLDPNYAKPYSGLAWTHILDAWFGWSENPREDVDQARKLAQKALSLNESVDFPHFTMALVHVMNREYDKAIASARRAVELSPHGAEAHAWLGAILHFTGKDEEAELMLKQAMKLNPMPRSYYYEFLASIYTSTGRYKEALAVLDEGLQRHPDNLGLYLGLATTYSLAGRKRQARTAMARVKQLDPGFSPSRMARMLPYKDRNVTKRLTEALSQAGAN